MQFWRQLAGCQEKRGRDALRGEKLGVGITVVSVSVFNVSCCGCYTSAGGRTIQQRSQAHHHLVKGGAVCRPLRPALPAGRWPHAWHLGEHEQMHTCLAHTEHVACSL